MTWTDAIDSYCERTDASYWSEPMTGPPYFALSAGGIGLGSYLFHTHATRWAMQAGADVSVTVRMDPKVKAAITTIGTDGWAPIEYTDAAFDEQAQARISRAEVAEIPFTAFGSRKATEQVPGRLVVRRIFDLNPSKNPGQETLFDTWCFHAFFTTTDPAVADTATIRRKLIAVPARVACSARRVRLHLPTSWPWESAWSDLFNRACGPPAATT